MTSNHLFAKNPVRKVTPPETIKYYVVFAMWNPKTNPWKTVYCLKGHFYIHSLLLSSMYKSMKAGPTLVVLKLLRASEISLSVAAVSVL